MTTEAVTIPIQYFDIVQLVSGGPPMTVVALSEWVECQWFDRRGVLHRGEFQIDALRFYQPQTWLSTFPPTGEAGMSRG